MAHSSVRHLEDESLVASVKALVELADQRTLQPLHSEYDESDAETDRGLSRQIPYDPASVFLVEIMISITTHRPDKIEEVW